MFPSGKVIKTGEIENPAEVINNLRKERFTGYACFTVKEQEIEDYSLAFIKGKMKAAFYENFKTREQSCGEKAFEKISQSISKKGFCDVVELNKEQVELAVTVRPESQINTRVIENEEETPEIDESGQAILKKYGLSSLAGKN